jgi:hypothetical protein
LSRNPRKLQRPWNMLLHLQLRRHRPLSFGRALTALLLRQTALKLKTRESVLGLNRSFFWRMPSSPMLCLVALVRTDVPEGRSAPNIRVTRIGELETALAVTSNRKTLRRNITCTLYSAACFSC